MQDRIYRERFYWIAFWAVYRLLNRLKENIVYIMFSICRRLNIVVIHVYMGTNIPTCIFPVLYDVYALDLHWQQSFAYITNVYFKQWVLDNYARESFDINWENARVFCSPGCYLRNTTSLGKKEEMAMLRIKVCMNIIFIVSDI
jgi:hypothetical protein